MRLFVKLSPVCGRASLTIFPMLDCFRTLRIEGYSIIGQQPINKIFCPRCRGQLVYTNQSQDRRELRQFYCASCGSTTTVHYWRGSEPEISTIKTIIEHKRARRKQIKQPKSYDLERGLITLKRRSVQSHSQISRFSEVNKGVSAIVSRGKFWQETKQIASRLPTTPMRI